MLDGCDIFSVSCFVLFKRLFRLMRAFETIQIFHRTILRFDLCRKVDVNYGSLKFGMGQWKNAFPHI
jgi:hypothetical protein